MSEIDVLKLLDLKQYKEALRKAQELVYYNPQSKELQFIMLQCYLKLGLTKSVNVLFSQLEQEPKYSQAIKLMRIESEERLVDHLYELKSYPECLKALEKVLKRDRNSVKYLKLKAKCLVRTHDVDNAEKIINKLLNRFPRDPGMIYLKGVTKYYRAEYPESLKLIRKSIELYSSPNHVQKCQDMAKKIENRVEKIQQADKLFTDKKYQEAELAYRNILCDSGVALKKKINLKLNILHQAISEASTQSEVDAYYN